MYRNIFFILLLFLSACNLDLPLEDEISGDDAVDTPEAAKEALNAAYSDYAQIQVSLSFLSDDFAPTYLIELNNSQKKLYYWNSQQLVYLSNNIWTSHYHTIAQLNTVLNSEPYIKLKDDDDNKEWKTVKGQAYALKAMVYFELLELYADRQSDRGIILKDKVELEYLKRSDITTCCDTIKNLLINAGTLLKDKDVTYNYISYYATLILRAKLMLQQRDYKGAQQLAQQVINDVGLPQNIINTVGYSALWTDNNSNEKLFAYDNYIFPLSEYNEKGDGDAFVVPDTIEYEDNDIRRSFTKILFLMKKNGHTSKFLRPLIGKYRLTADDKEPKDINRIRLAEAYFIAGESYAQNDELIKAYEIVNSLLATRGASLIPENLSKTELMEKILYEKQKEFIGEGIRFFDLKRLNKSIIRYKVDSPNISNSIDADDFRRVFPIPLAEIKQNKKIKQNPGWESIISNIN